MEKEPNMKTGWKVLIAAGVVLTLVSGQVLAQPGGSGPGWGPGPGAGPGAGRGWNRGNQPAEQMFNGPDANQEGRRPQGNAGPGTLMPPRGRGWPGQPFRGGQGQGGRMHSPRWGRGSRAVPTSLPPDRGGPGAGRLSNRGNPSLEQIFDEADANKDGTLTKEEIRAFQEARRGNGPGQP